MFCPYCGAQLEDGTKFCPTCGKALAQEAAPVEAAPVAPVAPEVPVAPVVAPVDEAKKTADARSAMILAIIGVALSETAIGGIILSSIAKKKVKAYQAEYGEINGMAKVAKILSTVGLILSIVMGAYYMIAGIVACVGCAANGLGNAIGNEIGNEIENNIGNWGNDIGNEIGNQIGNLFQ